MKNIKFSVERVIGDLVQMHGPCLGSPVLLYERNIDGICRLEGGRQGNKCFCGTLELSLLPYQNFRASNRRILGIKKVVNRERSHGRGVTRQMAERCGVNTLRGKVRND